MKKVMEVTDKDAEKVLAKTWASFKEDVEGLITQCNLR